VSLSLALQAKVVKTKGHNNSVFVKPQKSKMIKSRWSMLITKNLPMMFFSIFIKLPVIQEVLLNITYQKLECSATQDYIASYST